MAMKWETVKDPDERLDYELDWSTLLAGDTITTSTWDVPTGITDDGQENTDTVTLIWLLGGTEGDSYSLVNTIHTAAGRIREQTCVLKIKTK